VLQGITISLGDDRHAAVQPTLNPQAQRRTPEEIKKEQEEIAEEIK
jgi:hypothetical protein